MVEEDTKVDPRDGVVNVGIVEDNVGRLATELEGDLLQVAASSGLHDLSSDEGGASEGNLVNIHVCRKGGTSDLSESRNDVDDTGREASFLDEGGSEETRQRSLFSRLDNDGVTTGNGGTDLPCPHEDREVPGNDLSANTDL